MPQLCISRNSTKRQFAVDVSSWRQQTTAVTHLDGSDIEIYMACVIDVCPFLRVRKI